MKGDGDKEENAYNVQERERERGTDRDSLSSFFVSLSSGKKESRKRDLFTE